MEQFGLQKGHVDVRRTFLLARLAGEAVAEGFLQFRAHQRVRVAETVFEHRAYGVGAAPSRHDFFAGGDVGRAHGRRVFAATAAPVALFEVSGERPVFVGERKYGGKRQRELVPIAHAQIRVDAEPVLTGDDLARIEDALWVEELLDLAHDREQFGSYLLLHELGTRDADAVFAGERRVEPAREAGGAFREFTVFRDVARLA